MGNLDNKSKLSDLEKAIMKKWLVPVSMQGVPSLADFNKHRDNAKIHFKLAAGDNITITEDPDTNTYTVSAAGGGGGGPTAPEPLPLDGTKLKNGHKYITTITPDTTRLDLSGIDLEDNASCELWLDNERNQNPPIMWPHAYWLDSGSPDHSTPYGGVFDRDYRAHYSLRKEGNLIIGRLAYISPIPE